MKSFTKTTLAAAVGGLMTVGSAQAGTTAYSLYSVWDPNLRLADLPVDDETAAHSSNATHTNYLPPNDWRDGSGAVVDSPNYGWTQGGGLPATWWTTLGGNDSASVNSLDRIAARQAGGFIGGVGANPADYAFDEPTALTVGSASYLDRFTLGGTDYAEAWGINVDIGLITVTESSDVTISLSGTTNPADLVGNGATNLRPGFSVWQGWDDQGGTRHTLWNSNGAPYLDPGAPSPFYHLADQESMTLLGQPRPADGMGAFQGTAWNTTNGGTATLTLSNLAAGNYAIVIGGYTDKASGISGSNGQNKQYSVGITTSAVPVPAAVWLFGSALAGLGIAGRRRREAR